MRWRRLERGICTIIKESKVARYVLLSAPLVLWTPPGGDACLDGFSMLTELVQCSSIYVQSSG